jgi:hypothetical protein
VGGAGSIGAAAMLIYKRKKRNDANFTQFANDEELN